METDEVGRQVARVPGRRVRRRRHFIDLPQEALAERAGIHRTQISLLEKGERMPLTVTLIKLAAALEVSVGQLLAGIKWDVDGPRSADREEGDRDG